MRAAWLAGWATFGLFAVAALAFGLAGALTDSVRVLHAAAVLLSAAFVTGFGMVVMSMDVGMPAKALPRADRKRLAAEERRIRFDAEIRRLEREVGQ